MLSKVNAPVYPKNENEMCYTGRMKKERMHEPPPFALKEGNTIELSYEDAMQMERDDDNWEHHCNYQLIPDALKGRHRVLQLRTMQIALADRPVGGMMLNAETAKGCMTFGVIEACSGKVSFAQTKLCPGDIVFFDDTQSYHFLSSGSVRLCAVNIRYEGLGDLLPLFERAKMKVVKDIDRAMIETLHAAWERFGISAGNENNADEITFIEAGILSLLHRLLTVQEAEFPPLTRGEAAAFAVRDKVLQHMDGAFNIASLAEEFHVSEKTLQNGFMSVFGFPPLQFIRALKLNHVHHELLEADPKQHSVSEIAQKWGFLHLGRFSHYYETLFGELPNQTLYTLQDVATKLPASCADKQETMG